jgi:hypothetical protein
MYLEFEMKELKDKRKFKNYAIMQNSGAVIVRAKSVLEALEAFTFLKYNVTLKDIYLY